VWLQPLNAFIRPKVDASKSPSEQSMTRRVWKLLHQTLGWACVVLGIMNIGYGVHALDEQHQSGEDGIIVSQIYGGVLAVVFVAAEVYVRFIRKDSVTTKSVDDDDAERVPMKPTSTSATATTDVEVTNDEDGAMAVDLSDMA
jgi:hypothetical protein